MGLGTIYWVFSSNTFLPIFLRISQNFAITQVNALYYHHIFLLSSNETHKNDPIFNDIFKSPQTPKLVAAIWKRPRKRWRRPRFGKREDEDGHSGGNLEKVDIDLILKASLLPHYVVLFPYSPLFPHNYLSIFTRRYSHRYARSPDRQRYTGMQGFIFLQNYHHLSFVWHVLHVKRMDGALASQEGRDEKM